MERRWGSNRLLVGCIREVKKENKKVGASTFSHFLFVCFLFGLSVEMGSWDD